MLNYTFPKRYLIKLFEKCEKETSGQLRQDLSLEQLLYTLILNLFCCKINLLLIVQNVAVYHSNAHNLFLIPFENLSTQYLS